MPIIMISVSNSGNSYVKSSGVKRPHSILSPRDSPN